MTFASVPSLGIWGQPVAVPVRQFLDVVGWISIAVRPEVDAAITVAAGIYVLHVFRFGPRCLLICLRASGPSWVSGVLLRNWKVFLRLVPTNVNDRLRHRGFALLVLSGIVRGLC